MLAENGCGAAAVFMRYPARMDLKCDTIVRRNYAMRMRTLRVDCPAKQFAAIALCLLHDLPNA